MAKKLKEWFDGTCADKLGRAIAQNYPAFDLAGFIGVTETGITGLELKDRVALMARALRERLPDSYPHAASIIEKSLGPELEGETGMFNLGYWLMPVARLVEDFGDADFDCSMRLLPEITKRNTSEYAIRPFLKTDLERTLQVMAGWTQSPNSHVRRLASEGVRPRLPWAKRLDAFIEDPAPALGLVEPLRADPSPYVRKSVANLLNDVSKDHPDLVRALAARWLSESDCGATAWIIRHGTRTLRKN